MSESPHPPPGTEVARLLAEWRNGNDSGPGRLFSLLYDELYSLARRQTWRSRPGETLCTTALVHEAYLKLVPAAAANDRHHFFALAARAMRQIVVDCARRHGAGKRGAGLTITTFDDASMDAPTEGPDAADVAALEEALVRLERADGRLARVVELRFFAGLSIEETAATLATSPATVKRDWRTARAFLFDALAPAQA